MKKRLIALTVLMVLLLTACGSKQGGSGSRHPYSWKERRDGSIRLTIKNAPEDGYAWVAEGLGNDMIQVERTDDGTGGQAVFSVTTKDPVSGTAIFACRRESAPGDTAFEIWLQVGVSDKGRLEVTQTEYREFPPAETTGAEGYPSCSWYSDPDGSSKLYLDSILGWSAMGYDETILSVGLPSYGESDCTYTLIGLAAGETSLLIYDLTQDYGFRLSATVADDLSVTLYDGEAGTFEIPMEQLPGMKEVTAYLGELAIPDGYRITECRSGDWNGMEQETNYVCLTLHTQEESWFLYATKDYSVTDFIALYLDGRTGSTRTVTSVNGYPAVLVGDGEQSLLFWADDRDRSFCLRSQYEVSASEELLAAANGLYSASEKGA